MLKKMMLALAGITIFTIVPTLAADSGCKKVEFYGTYTRLTANVDVIGDPAIQHNLVYQLELRADGTASEYWTGFPDYMMNAGTSSPAIGSWTCRSDGKLVVNLLFASFAPIPPGTHPNAPGPDIVLTRHYRTTHLFSVDDENTLTRIQSRTRRYTQTEDPTNPAAGTLLPLNNATATYNRFVASDADLLIP